MIYLLLFCAYPISDVVVIDGDTFRGTIILPWDIALYQVTIQAADYTAPRPIRRPGETASDDELRRGREIIRSLRMALQSGTLYAEPVGRGHRNSNNAIVAVLWMKRRGRMVRLSKWLKDRGYIASTADNGSE